MSASERRIIIVGAGPVGLMAAYLLSHNKIPCLVLEQGEAISTDLRASTFHPSTLDMLDLHGLSQPLIDMGLICPTWQIRVHETNERVLFDLSVLKDDTNHPYRLQCEQSRLCTMLLEKIQEKGDVEVRFGAKVTAYREIGDTVEVDVETAAGTEVMDCSILIGADGARSSIRNLIGATFEGVTYPETTILATTQFPFEEHLPDLSNVNYVWKKDGTFSLLRLKDRWRVSIYPPIGMSIEEAMQPEQINAAIQDVVARPEPYEILECRAYHIHRRIVGDYRKGRVVLAGDSAHINSPSGGMGMNGGIHDAYNLVEKLTQIWNGASLDLLDLYTRQRRPVAAEEVLAQADRNRSRMQERDTAKRLEILKGLQDIVDDKAQAREYLLRSSLITALRQAAQIQ
ncbi:FAD-dependent oxidoreductase [Govanella unica]|uniref:FAD-dependent monooxygenase n=1 Tax=Govanella unica TaxID=2975056 RepID=A0A9X3TW94_9PROT|nr:NAD(P)/FAD-dependent oxidoreductase [Govania unica]MDA5192884.1 FAD-dependent monooxygenase [Govania unica]